MSCLKAEEKVTKTPKSDTICGSRGRLPYNVPPNLNMPMIDDLLHDAFVHKKINTLCKHLDDIDSIKKGIPDLCAKLLDAAVLIDGVINHFPPVRTMHNRLGVDAEIVENPKFETALVKVQDRCDHKLTTAEKKMCSTYSILLFCLRGRSRQGQI